MKYSLTFTCGFVFVFALSSSWLVWGLQNRFWTPRLQVRDLSHHNCLPSTAPAPIRKAPPKIKPVKTTPNKPKRSWDPVKENENTLLKDYEAFLKDDAYLVILYNDSLNKRGYVVEVLMEVFLWSETRANDVMMEAHVHGSAVCGEYAKEVAMDYVGKLNARGLIAEAVPVDGDRASNEGGGDSPPQS